jgi:hypothetical protein
LWQFDFWETVPNYNSLTLSGLLLFCAGLSWWRRIADERGTIVLIACVALTALGLGIVALAKPTSFAVALCTGAAWIVWARPARPFLFAILTVCVLTVFGIVAVYAIDGGVVAFWHRIVSGLALLQSGQSWDVHGIGHSVLAPVLPGRFAKSVVIAGCTAFLFGVDFGALNVVVNGYRRAAKVTAVAAAAAVSLLITALFRAKFGLTAFPGYYAWHFALLALFAAVCTVSLPQLMAHTCRVIKEGVLLAIVPVAYSFGTNNPLFFHMAGASVFWAAAAVAVCNATRRLDLLAATTTLCGAATAGMLLGVVAAPRPSEPPLWKANLAVEIGPDHAKLLVDSDTLDYLRALGRGALQAGFRPGTPILDLSGTGPGFIFFASASAPVTPWLVSDAADTQATARKALSEIPQPVLEQSWIVIGADGNFAVSVGTLQNAGLNFPAGYQPVASAARPQFGWAQTLWKPVRPAVTPP